METYSLLELNQFVRQVLSLNFPETIWIRAEIAQINKSKGHYFIDLWEKAVDSDEAIAQSSAVIWAKSYMSLFAEHGKLLNEVLTDGAYIRVQVRVDFHVRYGLKLTIVDIDPAWTLGQLALKRRETIEILKGKGLLEKNRNIDLPIVLQRIAVISSQTAAGLGDFLQHLEENPWTYAFKTTLFATTVQGQNVLPEMLSALRSIQNIRASFDCVVIIRGGGARADLSAFDSLDLAQKVANFPLPILVGIGHQVDETILDLVAHSSLKTPTAVADAILTHNQIFESKVYEITRHIHYLTQNEVQSARFDLQQLDNQIRFGGQRKVQQAQDSLTFIERTIRQSAENLVKSKLETLAQTEQLLSALDPLAVFNRGFTMTTKKGKIISSVQEVMPKDEILTHTKDGVFPSVVGD